MSGFTSIMKAIGSGLLKVIGIAGPVVNTLFPAAAPFEQALIQTVGTIEQFSQGLGAAQISGTQKASLALPIIVQLLKDSNLVAGKEIADPDQFQKAAQSYIDGTVALLNSLKHS